MWYTFHRKYILKYVSIGKFCPTIENNLVECSNN